MKGKVLIVDDDPIMGNLLEVRLSESGFESLYFESGEEALDKIHQVKPDIIISDIVMPIMNGYELHRRLRQDASTSGIPFLFLSAKSEKSDQMKGLRMGADDYVCKPFKIEDLIERIERVMESAVKAKTFNLKDDFSDVLSAMKLNEVLQVVELNHKSGELLLTHSKGEKIGRILFRDGKLINAEKPPLKGVEAFFELMEETEGFFEFYGKTIPDEPDIITDTNRAILVKAGNLIVESKKLYDKIPNTDVFLVRIPADNRKASEYTPTSVKNRIINEEGFQEILSLIDQRRTVREIINCGTMSRLRASAILSDLLNEKLVKIYEPEPDIPEEKITGEPVQIRDAVKIKETKNLEDLIAEELVTLLRECEKKSMTGILKIENIPEKAAVYIQEGSPVHAYYGKTTAKKALYRIFSQKGAAYSFNSQTVSVYNAIDEPLNFLLEEGMKAIKNFRELKPESFDRFVMINNRKLKKHPRLLRNRGFNYILSLVRQYGGIKDIIEASQMTDFHTYKNLMFMIKIGAIDFDTRKRFGIQIITESSADLPSELIQNPNISVIPISFRLDGNIYRDRTDMLPEDFYSLLEKSKASPVFPPPDSEHFHTLFENIIAEKNIFAIFPSGKISRTFEYAASVIKKNYNHYLRKREEKYADEKDIQIELIDSQMLSLGMGLLVAEAADKIEKGWGIKELKAYTEKLIPKVRVIIAANEFSYFKTGHIVKSGFLTNKVNKILGIYPIFSLWNGELIPVDHVRGEKNACHQMIKLIKESLESPDMPIKAGVIHANVPERAEDLKDMLVNNLNCQDIIISCMGPVTGSRCGHGSLGIACLPLSEKQETHLAE